MGFKLIKPLSLEGLCWKATERMAGLGCEYSGMTGSAAKKPGGVDCKQTTKKPEYPAEEAGLKSVRQATH